MTVKELIEKLQEFDENLIVAYDTNDVGLLLVEEIKTELYYNYCDVKHPLTDAEVLCLS